MKVNFILKIKTRRDGRVKVVVKLNGCRLINKVCSMSELQQLTNALRNKFGPDGNN